jgi:hypothetical protein
VNNFKNQFGATTRFWPGSTVADIKKINLSDVILRMKDQTIIRRVPYHIATQENKGKVCALSGNPPTLGLCILLYLHFKNHLGPNRVGFT